MILNQIQIQNIIKWALSVQKMNILANPLPIKQLQNWTQLSKITISGLWKWTNSIQQIDRCLYLRICWTSGKNCEGLYTSYPMISHPKRLARVLTLPGKGRRKPQFFPLDTAHWIRNKKQKCYTKCIVSRSNYLCSKRKGKIVALLRKAGSQIVVTCHHIYLTMYWMSSPVQ